MQPIKHIVEDSFNILNHDSKRYLRNKIIDILKRHQGPKEILEIIEHKREEWLDRSGPKSKDKAFVWALGCEMLHISTEFTGSLLPLWDAQRPSSDKEAKRAIQAAREFISTDTFEIKARPGVVALRAYAAAYAVLVPNQPIPFSPSVQEVIEHVRSEEEDLLAKFDDEDTDSESDSNSDTEYIPPGLARESSIDRELDQLREACSQLVQDAPFTRQKKRRVDELLQQADALVEPDRDTNMGEGQEATQNHLNGSDPLKEKDETIKRLKQQLKQRDLQLGRMRLQLREKELQLAQKDLQLAEKDLQLEQSRLEIQEVALGLK